MTRLCGACCGLTVFSAMIVCGLMAGNAVELILGRAVVGLFAGVILGAFSGWVALFIVQDNIEKEQGSDAGKSAETPKVTT
jgi:ABC-type microcin C transport system permease subunit YejE